MPTRIRIPRPKQLEHSSQTGRVRPHEQTSYFSLLVFLLLTGLVLGFSTVASSAWTRPGPAAGSVGLTGVVKGDPPTVGAVILTPANNARFTETPISITGTCPKGGLVEIFKNDIFAGSTVCSENNTFELKIDLLIGQNILQAKVYDALNQEGPASPAITVFYDALPNQGAPLSSLNFGGDQLVLNTDAVFRGAFPGKEMSIPIDIIGGRAPYAINIQWGDAQNTVLSRPDNSSFRTVHTYDKAGTFQLSLQATDADGRVAFLTVASVVNGQPDPIAAASATTPADRNAFEHIIALWPVYTAMVAVVVSFWLGEQREKRMLVRHGVIAG